MRIEACVPLLADGLTDFLDRVVRGFFRLNSRFHRAKHGVNDDHCDDHEPQQAEYSEQSYSVSAAAHP